MKNSFLEMLPGSLLIFSIPHSLYENKGQENLRKFVQSYQSPEVRQAAEIAFEGGAIKGW
jgi:ABC-type metal ion transport system substrate-binding protein